MLRGASLVLCAVILAGCGGGTKASCPASFSRAVAHLDRDIAAIRSATTESRVSHATDVFLHDVFTAPIDDLTRNRLIDHAAAAAAGSCTQCFQALEADRPVIDIHYGGGARAVCASARRAP